MVRASKELRVILEHFDKYPLITQKQADFNLFKQVVEMLSHKEHLTPEGINKIIGIKASVNLGLSEELKAAFPNTIPVPKPIVEDQEIKDPNWLSGFVSAEGCFLIVKKKRLTSGHYVVLKFQITQHIRDDQLMKRRFSFLLRVWSV